MGTARTWQGSKWIRPEKRRAIYTRDHHRCVYCGEGVDDGIILTLDHVVARELGGTNAASNLVTACRHCNSAKRHLTVRQFIVYLMDQGVETDGIAARVRNALRRKVRR